METRKSLKWYFIVIGILGFYWMASTIVNFDGSILSEISIALNMIFGGLFLYIGIDFGKMIGKSSKFIIHVLWASAAINVIGAIYEIMVEKSGMFFAGLLFIVLLNIYLIRNVERLSVQKDVPESQNRIFSGNSTLYLAIFIIFVTIVAYAFYYYGNLY